MVSVKPLSSTFVAHHACQYVSFLGCWQIVEVPVEVEKIVEVPVEIERIIEKIIEVPVPVSGGGTEVDGVEIVEKIVEVEKIIEVRCCMQSSVISKQTDQKEALKW